MVVEEAFVFHPGNEHFLRGQRHQPTLEGRHRWLLIMVIILLATTVSFTTIIMTLWRDTSILQNRGVETVATYTDKRTEPNGDGGRNHYLSYTFTVGEAVYTNEIWVSRDVYESTTLNTPVNIRYDPTDPQRTQQTEQLTPPWAATSLPVFLMAITLVFIWLLRRRTASYRYLRRHGQVVIGQVDAVEQTTDAQGNPLVCIQYSFITPDHNQRQDGEKKLYPNTSGVPIVDTPLAVYYAAPNHFQVL